MQKNHNYWPKEHTTRYSWIRIMAAYQQCALLIRDCIMFEVWVIPYDCILTDCTLWKWNYGKVYKIVHFACQKDFSMFRNHTLGTFLSQKCTIRMRSTEHCLYFHVFKNSFFERHGGCYLQRLELNFCQNSSWEKL